MPDPDETMSNQTPKTQMITSKIEFTLGKSQWILRNHNTETSVYNINNL